MSLRQRRMKRRIQIFVLAGILIVSCMAIIGGLIALYQQSQSVETVSSQTWPGGGGDQLVYGVGEDGLTPVPLKVTVLNGYGALDVFIQDQHTKMLFVPFLVPIATVTMTENTVAGQYTVSLQAGHSFTPTEWFSLRGNGFFYDGMILVTSTNIITLDQPIDRVYIATNTLATRSSGDLNIDASGGDVIAYVEPPSNISWDVTGIRLVIECETEPDDSKFGNLTVITNGITLRKRSPTGNYANFGTAHSNGDMALFTGQVDYTDKSGGGNHGVRIVADFKAWWGVTIRLRGGQTPNTERLEMIIRDDLSTLIRFHILAIGHVVD